MRVAASMNCHESDLLFVAELLSFGHWGQAPGIDMDTTTAA